jgi:hypothetical protein
MTTKGKGYMSGLALDAKCLPLQPFPRPGLGQSYPKHYPQPPAANGPAADASRRNPLGAPLSIREVAELIGCSAWTVRQSHVPRGLPCFRSGPNGKLIFYRDQVIAWILLQQQKGGQP